MTDDQPNEPTGEILSEDERGRAKKKRRPEMTEEEAIEMVHSMMNRMNQAADEDIIAINEKRPGLAKLALLDEALGEISKPKWIHWYLREGICQALSRWLTPVPGSSLPNQTIRAKILQLLKKLPIHAGNFQGTDLGLRLIALWKSSEETEENRVAIRDIVQTVLRPIFSIRASHRSTDISDEVATPLSRGITDASTQQQQASSSGAHENRPSNVFSTRRARIPTQATYTFKVMPKSNVKALPHQDNFRDGDGAMVRLNRMIAHKRMSGNRQISRAQTVSVSRSVL